jgi:hypothetical protein
MPVNQTFLIVEKTGSLKEVSVKSINKDEIYKKCGFRKPDGFECRTTWKNVKVGNQNYSVQLWARDDGKADTENKYDFPPPVDNTLYFGNCALVQVLNNNHDSFTSLSKDLWLKIYEALFGGFEDIGDENDDDEPDELDAIKKDMKTKKTGYLKDGFVVDSDEEEEVVASDVDEESDEDDEDSDEDVSEDDNDCDETDAKSDLVDNESDNISAGSELDEESYDYSDEDE